MAQRSCIIDGCGKRHFCRGWCMKHYSRWQRHGDPLRENVRVQWAESDFEALVDRSGGPDACHPWRGAIDEQGYGRYRSGVADQRAHREAYTRALGEEPDDETRTVLDHRCHDPKVCAGGPTCPHRRCCNPAHLLLVTHDENLSKERNARWGPAYRASCSVKGCGRPHKTNGLCDAHYSRLKKHGDTFPSVPIASDRRSRRKL